MFNVVFDRRMRAIILTSVVLIFGIIHFGVGVGIVAKYNKYHDVFVQQVGLSGYNIFLGIFAIAVGIVGLLSVLKGYRLLGEITAAAAFILGIFTFASLIAALALSGQTASHLHDSITDYMNSYAEEQESITVIDTLQTTYQCCGVNLWLDWSRVQLGAQNEQVIGRRRRQHPPPPESPLARVLRQKRQIVSGGSNIYNLPATYTVYLPLSCCSSGGVTTGNSLGGYCGFNVYNGSSSFYVSGCLEPVSNIGFSQITGIAVINTCLAILAFVYVVKLLTLFPIYIDSNNKNPNQNGINQGQQQQQQQNSYPQYYGNNNNPNQNGINQGQQPQQGPYQPYYVNNNNPNQNGINQEQQQYSYPPYYGDINNLSPSYTYNDPTFKTYL